MGCLQGKQVRGTSARRGSALLLTLIMSIALAGVVVYAVTETMTASSAAQREDHYARALSAAEYGAELAIAEIGAGVIADGTSEGARVEGDFVTGTPADPARYENAEGTSTEQRRITGAFDQQEFRVKVRSARQVYSNPGEDAAKALIEGGWLKAPEGSDIPLEQIKAYQFRDTYEITSTARSETISQGARTPVELAGSPVVQAVVTFDYGSITDKLLGDTGLIHGEDSGNLQVQDRLDATAPVAMTVSSFALASLSDPLMVDNITVTGEDHYLTTYWNDTVILGKQILPMKLQSDEPNFFGATGSYWEQGNITFNYKMPKNPANNNDLVNRDKEAINPYRPRTTVFSTGTNDRAMFVKDKNATYDMYLLGGKTVNSNGSGGAGTGRTITVIDRDKVYSDKVNGKIVETKSSAAGNGANFDIVLPRFEDLRNMYINVTNEDSGNDKTSPGKWKQMYIGQYSNGKRGTSRIEPTSIPLLAGTKIRPQSVHTVRNSDKQILVRLYAGEENGKKVYYKYPTETTWGFRPWYEMYLLSDVNINMANVLNKYASDKAGFEKGKKDGTFVQHFGDDRWWYETDDKYPVRHPETGEVVSSTIWFEYRPCALGDSLYGKKYYGNFWYVDANDGKTKEQPQSGFKNLNMLVHVYVGDRLVVTKGTEWTGYYVWADATFAALTNQKHPITNSGKTYSGFYLDEAKEKMQYRDRSNRLQTNNRLPVGRIFPWQEIVGYSLVKRTDATGKGEPAMINQSDSGADKRTMYANSVNGRAVRPAERIVVGFDEVYQASADTLPPYDVVYNASIKALEEAGELTTARKNELKRMYNERVGKHPLFPATDKSPGYLMDRKDPVRVVMIPDAPGITDADGKITGYAGGLDATSWDVASDTYNPDIRTYRTMDDFLFEKEFQLFSDADVDNSTGTIGDDAEIEKVVLDAVNIMGGYEDMQEASADYDYADLMFTVYIAAAEREQDANVVDRASMPWWERDEVEGLTGDKSRLAVSFNNNVADDGDLSAKDILDGNFNRIGSDVAPETNLSTRVWTMVADESVGFIDFPRAAFRTTGGVFELDTGNKQIKEYIENWGKVVKDGSKPVFYFTKADAMDLVIFRVRAGEEDLSAINLEEVNQKLVEYFDAEGRYEMREIVDRYGLPVDTGDKAGLLRKDRADLVNANPSSFGISRDDVYVREVAGAFAGYKTYTVPAVETEGFAPIDNEASPEALDKNFLAGEAAPFVQNGTLSFDASTTVPLRSDELEIEGDTFPAKVRKARIGAYLSTGPDTRSTVDKLYAEPYPVVLEGTTDNATRATVWSTLGMKDRRGSIGFHRGGDLADVEYLIGTQRITEENIPEFLDRYEPVYLGKKGLQPFRTSTDNRGIAQELQNPGAPEESRVYAPEFTYQGDETATFVLDRPLDGAGVMVVNGNLVVQDTFAYHGILVVTGDLVIRPTLKKDQFVWSIDGWPTDAYGNRVIPNDLNRDLETGYTPSYDTAGNWYYVPGGLKNVTDLRELTPEDKSYVQVDRDDDTVIYGEDGKPVYVRPLRVDEYRGELNLQGKLLVKGRIITEKLEVKDDEGEVVATHVGKLNAYWSKRAVDTMSGMFPLGKPVVQRVSWIHNDSIPVETMWQNKQDTGKDE